MASGLVHFEVFVRRTAQSPWTLEGATESRHQAMELAESLFNFRKVAAVRVSKEVLDPATREYASYVLMAKGMLEPPKRTKVFTPSTEPACVSPQDLYTAHAREKIGRLLDDWLRRRGATAFELLHRPDLAESLEASSIDLKQAVQKVVIPESQSTGASPDELTKAYEKLAAGALERLISAGRKKLFPDLARESLDGAVRKLANSQDRQFLLGCSLAQRLADAQTWTAKMERLLDLAEAMPADAQPRALCRSVIEPMLSDMLATRSGLADLLGPELDSGGALLALTRLVAPTEMQVVATADPAVRALVPEMNGPAARLAALMGGDEFKSLRAVLGRKILGELNGAKRLRPDDPDGEIAVLRALAMVLTASAGRVLSLDEVQAAFLERSKVLTASDFVTALAQGRTTVLAEAQALLRLAENVTGQVNRTRAAEWLATCVDSLKFETEFRAGGADTALTRLSTLAALDRSVRRAGLAEGDLRKICGRLGDLGGVVEADAKLCALLGRSPAPLAQRAAVLLRLAAGEAAPPGPAADRAKAVLMQLLKAPEARAALAAAPELATRLRDLMAA